MIQDIIKEIRKHKRKFMANSTHKTSGYYLGRLRTFNDILNYLIDKKNDRL